jgi:hypothetical protein
MSVIAAQGAGFMTRRNWIVAILLALGAAIAVGIATRPDLANLGGNRFANAVSQSVKNGVQGIKTVAAMMAERSPGERAKGALASLKHKRLTELHERALPKVRAPSPPVSPLASIVTAPPAPPALPPVSQAPLFGMVAAPPVTVPPVTGGGGATPGGPPPFSDIPLPGGGGSIVPPITTTQVPPPPPPASAVPEPDSWALMLLGFAFTGLALRRDRRRAALAATG